MRGNEARGFVRLFRACVETFKSKVGNIAHIGVYTWNRRVQSRYPFRL
jgi:hypothetical protein